MSGEKTGAVEQSDEPDKVRAADGLPRPLQVIRVFNVRIVMRGMATLALVMAPGLVVLLLPSTAVRAQAPTPLVAPASPVLSMFAAGNNGPGWWTLEVDRAWNMKVRVVGTQDRRNPTRRLSPEERAEILRLVSDLPRGKRSYSFMGPSIIDATVDFALTVGVGKEQRRYVVNDTFDEYEDHSELRPMLAAMHYLRGLIVSEQAHVPPPVGGRSHK